MSTPVSYTWQWPTRKPKLKWSSQPDIVRLPAVMRFWALFIISNVPSQMTSEERVRKIQYWWSVATKIWVVTRHQYGISALVSETSFGGETSGSVAKCRLFSQATLFVICMKNEFRSKRGKTVLLLSTISSAVTSAELHLVQFVKCWQFFSRVEL